MATLDDLRSAFQDLADDAPRTCPSDFRHRRTAALADQRVVRPARRRIPRWAPPVAAAAAAAVVAGTVVAIEHGTGHPTPPSKSGSAFCIATLPPAWVSPIPLGSTIHSLDGAFPDGSLIVAVGQGSATTLKRVAGDGETITLLSVPAASGATVSAAVAGTHALLMVTRDHTISALYAYDGSALQETPVVPKTAISFAGVVDSATIMGGTAYWDERASHVATDGRVVAYDIATGAKRVVWQGTFPDGSQHLAQTAGGVYLGALGKPTTVLIAARPLPPAVAVHMTPAIRESLLVSGGMSLVTNGGSASYAWLTNAAARVLEVWSPGMAQPEHRNLGAGSPELVSAGFAEFSFDGRWLYAGPENLLIDLDTSAMARLPSTGAPYVLAGPYLVGFDGANITRLPLTDLADLHC